MNKLILSLLLTFIFNSAQAVELLKFYEYVEEPELGYIEFKRHFFAAEENLYQRIQKNNKREILSQNTLIMKTGIPFERTIKLGSHKITVKLVGRFYYDLLIIYDGKEKFLTSLHNFERLRIHPQADLIEIFPYYKIRDYQEDKAVYFYKLSPPKLVDF